MMWRLIIFFFTLLFIFPAFADQLHTDTQGQITIPFGKSYDYNNIKVKRVIGGDTIQLEDGKRVRYIGINTPETKDPRRPVEFMGKETYLFNKQLVEGKKVMLEFDVEKKDKYGRLLAYVFLDYEPLVELEQIEGYHYVYSDAYGMGAVTSVFVNATIVKSGYAQVSTYPPNVKYADLFRQLEREAREAGRGLWSNSALAKKEYYYVASKRSQVFHRPECPYASKIADYNRVRYNSREEAVKAGKRRCSKCKP